MDNREDSPFVWWKKGQRFHALKSGRRQQRVSSLAAMRAGQLLAPLTFEGSCYRLLLELWLEQHLLPLLKPSQVVILDNASFHKGGRIRELIKAARYHLLYLPPYSPDFNPIERWWARMNALPDGYSNRGKPCGKLWSRLCAVCLERHALSYTRGLSKEPNFQRNSPWCNLSNVFPSTD